jgi:hypothetical protein
VAAVACHHDRLLAQKAALGEADGLRIAADVEYQAVFIDIHSENRGAGLDAEDLEGVQPGRLRTGLHEGLPNLAGALSKAHDVIAGQPQRIVAANVGGGRGPEGALHVLQLLQLGHVLSQRLLQRLPGLGAGEVELGILARSVGEVHCFADEEVIEVLDDLVRQSRRHVQPEPAALPLQQQMIDEDRRHHAGLSRAKIRLAACPHGHAGDVVGAEVVQEDASFRPCQLHLAPVGNIEDGRPGAGLPIFGQRIAEMSRHLPAGKLGKYCPGSLRLLIQGSAFSHIASFKGQIDPEASLLAPGTFFRFPLGENSRSNVRVAVPRGFEARVRLTKEEYAAGWTSVSAA